MEGPRNKDMTSRWAVTLPSEKTEAAAALRLAPGIEVHLEAGRLWLRGGWRDAALEAGLRALPDAERFDVLPDELIRPWNSLLPTGRLPEGPWASIGSWFQVELPVARLAGRGPRRVVVTPVPSSRFEQPNLLVVRDTEWARFATSAPRLRLDRLQFAASRDGRVIILGEPLPSLSGLRYRETARIAIPCGWAWPAGIDAATVRLALGFEASELALFSPTGSWERLAGDDFVRATRSAARDLVSREPRE